MKILLKNIQLYHKGHPFHLKETVILIEGGKVSEISPTTGSAAGQGDGMEADMVVDGKGLGVSIGWFDMRSMLNEPGQEYKEDIDSLCEAAAAGGFTEVSVLPNTDPVIQSKEAIQFIRNRTLYKPVKLHSIAAVSKGTNGEEMTEMLDLYKAGAVAFSDGAKTIWNTDLLSKALLYLKPINGLLVNLPEDPHISAKGLVHEGAISTMVGMKGIPAITEEVALKRDLTLLEYTGGRIHFANISTAKGIDIIKKAKASGLNVTCDVAAYQVAFTDQDLLGFDTNLKVNPPIRSEADGKAIWKGLKDGTIDVIVSSHNPQDQESKMLEFDLAEFGMLNLETAFSAIMTHKPANIPLEDLIDKWTLNPRKILNLPLPDIQKGSDAQLTIFDPGANWVLTEAQLSSKSKNSPFLGKNLKGKPLGIINGDQQYFSTYLNEKITS